MKILVHQNCSYHIINRLYYSLPHSSVFEKDIVTLRLIRTYSPHFPSKIQIALALLLALLLPASKLVRPFDSSSTLVISIILRSIDRIKDTVQCTYLNNNYRYITRTRNELESPLPSSVSSGRKPIDKL